MKFLVVDDSRISRKIISVFLQKLDYEVLGEASNGKEAIELYFKLKPDIVIMDIIMPFMNGLQALEYIMTKDPCAKVIMCSSMGQKDYIMKAIMFGARDFIVKPIEIERLKEVLDKF